jgi:alpha-tubulin suppressor-like RCC1 family protein
MCAVLTCELHMVIILRVYHDRSRQLGVDVPLSGVELQELKFHFNDEIVIKVVAGTDYSAFLTSKYEIMSCVKQEEQRNVWVTRNEIHGPECITKDSETRFCITDIEGGDRHFFMMHQNGRLYGSGSSRNGRLGLEHGNVESVILIPNDLFGGENVVKVRSGTHTIFMTVSGAIYGSGQDDDQQLGQAQSQGTVLNPTRLYFPTITTRIVDFSCGGIHTLFLTGIIIVNFYSVCVEDGSCYGCGYNLHGAANPFRSTPKIGPPQLITRGISRVVSGFYHSFFLSRALI